MKSIFSVNIIYGSWSNESFHVSLSFNSPGYHKSDGEESGEDPYMGQYFNSNLNES